MCGALGPGRDTSRRVHCNYRAELWRKPPIGSDHFIHTFLFPISTAARLSGDRTSQCVWDGQAPRRGLVIAIDLRKSQLSDFGGVIIWQLRPHSFRYTSFIGCSSVFFFFLPIIRFISSAQSHICVGERLAHFFPKGQRQDLHYSVWI